MTMELGKFDFSSLKFTTGNSALTFQNKKEEEFIHRARIKHKPVMFENAEKLAKSLDIAEDYFCLVTGSFIYGDFIEALCKVHDLKPKRVLISTLGMNANNIDSIVNLVDYLGAGYVGLVVSSYFHGTERSRLVPYMVQEFKGRPVQVGVCASHTKLCLIESEKTGKLVMNGSANLSSSDNLEAFSFSHDDGVFDYCDRILSMILNKWQVYDGESGTFRFKQDGNQGRKLAKEIGDIL